MLLLWELLRLDRCTELLVLRIAIEAAQPPEKQELAFQRPDPTRSSICAKLREGFSCSKAAWLR